MFSVNVSQTARLVPAFIFAFILKIILFSGKIGSSWEIKLLSLKLGFSFRLYTPVINCLNLGFFKWAGWLKSEYSQRKIIQLMHLIQLSTHKVPIVTWEHFSYPASPAAATEDEYRSPTCPLRKLPVHVDAINNLRHIRWH